MLTGGWKAGATRSVNGAVPFFGVTRMSEPEQLSLFSNSRGPEMNAEAHRQRAIRSWPSCRIGPPLAHSEYPVVASPMSR